MPSLESCILSAQKQGSISPEAAQDLIQRYNAFLGAFRQTMGEGEAARQAKAMLIERLDAEGLQRKRAALLQLDAAERIKERLLSNANARGEADPARALAYQLEYTGELFEGGGTSVMGRWKALESLAISQMHEAVETFRPGALGVRRNKAKMENVVHEILGKDTGDPAAKAMAHGISKAVNDLRERFNLHGGMIGKVEGGYIPTGHDPRAIRAAGWDQWSADIKGWIAPERMKDHLTDRPLLPEQLTESLQHVFDTITTQDWAHRTPGMSPGGKGALFKQHAESRFLVFKDSESWLAYQRKYGNADVYETILDHINVMTRDIALMQEFGPNPVAGFEYAKQLVRQQAALATAGREAVFPKRREITGLPLRNPENYAERYIQRAAQMMDYITGISNIPVNETFADIGQTARNYAGAELLGRSLLSALTDIPAQAFARMFAGMPSAKLLPGVMEIMRGKSQQELRRAALNVDVAIRELGHDARASSARYGAQWSAWLQDRILGGGLQHLWTRGTRGVFQRDMAGMFADNAHLALTDLPANARRLLDRYGINAGEWDIIRAAPKHEMAYGLQTYILRAADIAEIDPKVVLELYAKRGETVPEPPGLPLLRRAEFEERNVRLLQNSLDSMRQETADLEAKIAKLPWLEKNGADAAQLRDIQQRIPRFEADIKARSQRAADLRAVAERDQAQFVDRSGRLDMAPAVVGDPADKAARIIARNIAERFHEMILSETEFASPSGTIRARTVLLGGTRPGTIAGERNRTAAQFLGFGASVFQLQVGRQAREIAHSLEHGVGRTSAALTATALLFSMTMLGALRIQLAALTDYKDPRPMDPASKDGVKFWLAAAAQGGGLGIFGDFLFADYNRMGNTMANSMAGPLAGQINALARLSVGNAMQAASGEPTRFGREAVELLRTATPFTNLWYWRAAWSRLAFDRLQRQVDPEAYKAFRERASQVRKDQRTDYWWSPGESGPARAPNWENAWKAAR